MPSAKGRHPGTDCLSQGRGGEKAHIFLLVAGDEDMQLLILAVVILGVATGPLLDTALATDGNLGVRLLLHALLGVAARPNDEADEVVPRVILLGYEYLRPTQKDAETKRVVHGKY